jgi:hypothetical protein
VRNVHQTIIIIHHVIIVSTPPHVKVKVNVMRLVHVSAKTLVSPVVIVGHVQPIIGHGLHVNIVKQL